MTEPPAKTLEEATTRAERDRIVYESRLRAYVHSIMDEIRTDTGWRKSHIRALVREALRTWKEPTP